MKNIRLLVLFFCLLLFVLQCGNDEGSSPGGEPKGNMGSKKGDIGAGKNKDNGGGKIDVDKLDIPDRMKEAIKSGKIPMDRVKEMLKARQGDAPLVSVEKVSRKNLNSYLVLNGTVEPERLVKVYSRLSAYVKQKVKEEGAYVKKGDLLALLDDTEIGILHRQAKIELEQAQLTLNDEKINLERSETLKKTNMISDQDFQISQANYNKAKFDYQNKTENFKNLELQLSYTKIVSPVEGYVTERLIEVGDRVNTNQHVYTVEDFNPLLIRVYVPSSDVVQLQEGMKAEITSEILDGRLFVGKLKLINPRIDVQSGTVKVTVEVFDKTMKLKPGMFVEVKIVIGEKEDVLVIPRKSITYKQNKAYVFIFERMKVIQREITLGVTEEDHIEVVAGLKEGDTIVTVGIESLKDGMMVQVAR
jgi:RND family efflux transporter MFP subunit